MTIWLNIIIAITFFVSVLTPNILSADVICNGNGFVKGELKKLTYQASANTLHATADVYTMIAFVEEDKISEASKVGTSALMKLGEAKKSLEKARTLPDSEFRDMNDWLRKLNYNNYAEKFRISPNYTIWQEVARASIQGGRGWIEQCLTLNTNLYSKAGEFLRLFPGKPKPGEVWNFMAFWQRELDRGRFLSIIFSK